MPAAADPYALRLAPYGFDALVRLAYLPTPIGVVRERVLDALELRPGMTVLELGCGTGGITRRLLRRGARVVAVDRSLNMLRVAARRVPGAELVCADARELRIRRRFDRALLGFFLHELAAPERVDVLRRAAAALAPGGRMVVADAGSPGSRLGRQVWRGFVRAFEPPTVLEVVDGALDSELREAGLEVLRAESLAAGRVRLHVARESAKH